MQTENTVQKRLRILGDDEIEALYGRPCFTLEEQMQHFSLAPREKAALEQFHSIKSRIHWILQLGYFKAKQLFFVFTLPAVEADVRYIQEQYFPHSQLTDLTITKVTRLKQRRLILDLCQYRLCGTREREQLVSKAQQAPRVSSKPIYILRELLQYLAEHRIVLPGYSLLQETVGQALRQEQERLMPQAAATPSLW